MSYNNTPPGSPYPLDPKYLVSFLEANINNGWLTDEEFREVVRNTLPMYEVEEESS